MVEFFIEIATRLLLCYYLHWSVCTDNMLPLITVTDQRNPTTEKVSEKGTTDVLVKFPNLECPLSS